MDMDIDLNRLYWLITHRPDRIKKAVEGTGYLAKTVLGVGTFLLDNEGDISLLTAKQTVTFEKFILPLLEEKHRS